MCNQIKESHSFHPLRNVLSLKVIANSPSGLHVKSTTTDHADAHTLVLRDGFWLSCFGGCSYKNERAIISSQA